MAYARSKEAELTLKLGKDIGGEHHLDLVLVHALLE